jgi:subfamily B ATP-binding cassette protein MsbA
VIQPEESHSERASTRSVLWRLLGYARPYLPLVVTTIVFSLLYAGGLTGRGYLAKPLMDEVLQPSYSAQTLLDSLRNGPGGEQVPPEVIETQRAELRERVEASLRFILLAVLVIVIGMPLARLIRDYAGEWVMTRMAVDMQIDLGEKLLRLPLAHHVRERRGDAVARVTNDTVVANRAQALVFGEAVQDIAQVILAAAWSIWLSWQLSLAILIVGPPVAIALGFFGRRIRKSSHRRQRQFTEVMQRLMQILSGIRVIKAFSAEPVESEAFRREAMLYFRRSMRVVRNRVFSRVTVELLTQATFVVGLLLGVFAMIHGWLDLSLGDLMAFMVISAMLYRPTKNLTRLYNAIQDALPAAARIFELVDASEDLPDHPGARPLPGVQRGIRYRDVHFSYGREPVLRGVDLEIAAGEVVALVGRTGSGKSTLADLLLRFHDPDQGSVEIDGIDLRDLERTSLREQIGVVAQDPFLFDASLLENIRYGRPDASFDEVVKAARAANAHGFIEKLPEGYDTPAGDLGNQLSGGQRQRVTIARAILRDPQILIFDEATSALDAKAEQLVQEAIWSLMEGRTVLVIAHRLSTVQNANRIAVLEDGRIAAVGTHDEVLESSDLYRELVELQLRPAVDNRA